MASAARLRLVYDAADPRVAVAAAPEVAPVARLELTPRRRDRFLVGIAISVLLHAGIVGAWMDWTSHGEALSEGGSDVAVVLEGVSVVLMDSSPSAGAASALPEAAPVDGASAGAVAATTVATNSAVAAAPDVAAVAARPSPVEETDAVALVGPVERTADMTPPRAAEATPAPERLAELSPSQAEAANPAGVPDAPLRQAADSGQTVAAIPDQRPGADAPNQVMAADEAADSAAAVVVADAADASARSVASDTLPAARNAADNNAALTTDVAPSRDPAVSPVEPADRLVSGIPADATQGSGGEEAAVAADAKVRTAVSAVPVAPAAIASAAAPASPDATAAVAASARAAPALVAVGPRKPVAAVDRRVAGVEIPSESEAPPPIRRPSTAPAPAAAPASVAEQATKGPRPGQAGSGGASADEAGRADSSAYQARLSAHLRGFRSFPEQARRQGLVGTAIVRFTVNRGGGVTAVALARSSGHGLLDGEAVAMVRRASPFPGIPPELGVASVTISAPVRFDFR